MSNAAAIVYPPAIVPVAILLAARFTDVFGPRSVASESSGELD